MANLMNNPELIKLAIVDKDGALVCPKSGNTFVQNPQDQELLPGVQEAVSRLVADGYVLVIASNQGGVAAGHKTLEDAIAEMQYCLSLLPQIDRAYFCPDYGKTCIAVLRNLSRWVDAGECWGDDRWQYRKPQAGMLYMAQKCACGFGETLEKIIFCAATIKTSTC